MPKRFIRLSGLPRPLKAAAIAVVGLLVATSSPIFSAQAFPLTLPAGPLFARTTAGTNLLANFGANFFGAGSAAVSGISIDLAANAIQTHDTTRTHMEMTTQGNFIDFTTFSMFTLNHSFRSIAAPNNGDTVIDVLPPGHTFDEPGDQAFISIELVALSLKSVAPVSIDFGSGAHQFDVYVDINPVGNQFGTLDLTRTDEETLTDDVNMGQTLTFRFDDLTDPGTTLITLSGIVTGEGFITIPEPVGMMLVGIGALALMRRNRARQHGRRAD